MKIYLDSNKRLIGYEVVFYDKKKEKRPVTNLENDDKKSQLFLSEKQNNFIRDYADKAGKISDLILKDDGTFEESKRQTIVREGDCINCPKTVVVYIESFKPNSDLQRHFKDKALYTFKELNTIPFDSINDKYLYYFDKSIIEFEKNGRYQIDRSLKRFFGLFTSDNKLAAFIYIIQKEIPIIMILYQDEQYDNAGYIVLNYLIDLFKIEKKKYLDLGGLTKNESGINQFKRKFGMTINIADRILFSDK
jgi:hypothetical protein